MSRMAIVHPGSLLARELREQLGQRPDLCTDLQLFSTLDDEVGGVTEVGGGVGLVQRLDNDLLAATDLVFLCGDDEALETALELVPETIPKVVLSSTASGTYGISRVAGSEQPLTSRTLQSPHPAVISVAHLLSALSPLAPRQAAATVIQPASMKEQPGLDELFAQTSAILNFTGERSEEVFGHQLAFNLVPVEGAAELGAQLAAIPGAPPAISLQVLQGGIFHSLSLSLWIDFEADPGEEAIRERLSEHRSIELADDPSTLGPIDAAANRCLLVGTVTPGAPNSYWLWAVGDNLTHSGTLNAIDLAAELLAV